MKNAKQLHMQHPSMPQQVFLSISRLIRSEPHLRVRKRAYFLSRRFGRFFSVLSTSPSFSAHRRELGPCEYAVGAQRDNNYYKLQQRMLRRLCGLVQTTTLRSALFTPALVCNLWGYFSVFFLLKSTSYFRAPQVD